MPTTPSIGSTTNTKDAQKTPPTNPLGQLGKDDFLKLMVAQLQHQDPSNPMDDKAFMGQMAQFATLEQVTNVAEGLDRLSFSGQVSQSVALIGHTIGFVRTDGTAGSGVAESITVHDGQILIKVGSEEVSPGDVVSVGGVADTKTDALLSGLQDVLDTLGKINASPAP
jgi:flagellar basal-body rod modification protein FlgD